MSAAPLSLVLMTRFPQAGRAKTRLIPALGAEGAAEFQRKMTRLAVARAWAFCAAAPGRRLVIAYDGGSEREMRDWLGRLNYLPQGEGDLGARMQRAVNGEFQRGARSVIVIGADCPRLLPGILESAARALSESDVTFGPASDGGYYLVGLRKPVAEIFSGIRWSTGEVLRDSVRRSQMLGIEPVLLEELPDVDEPDDLPDAQAALAASRTISVIIPALNEAAHIAATIGSVSAGRPHEIIVADGGSTDDTLAIALAAGATVIQSAPGRARQMNAGAARATGGILLFLHADTLLPRGWTQIVQETLEQIDVAAGAFKFCIGGEFTGRSLVEWTTNFRSRWFQSPYGDQAQFLRRSLFEELGGFADLPIMEDYELNGRLRKRGRVATASEAAVTSGRRWKRMGFLKTTLVNQIMIVGFHLGVCPATLARFYRRRSVGS